MSIEDRVNVVRAFNDHPYLKYTYISGYGSFVFLQISTAGVSTRVSGVVRKVLTHAKELHVQLHSSTWAQEDFRKVLRSDLNTVRLRSLIFLADSRQDDSTGTCIETVLKKLPLLHTLVIPPYKQE